MGWWQNASDDERMAQVEGGIECRMNIDQIATASRCTREDIQAFGDEHGLSFGGRRHPKNLTAPPKESPKAVFDRAEQAKRQPTDGDFMLDDDALQAWASS